MDTGFHSDTSLADQDVRVLRDQLLRTISSGRARMRAVWQCGIALCDTPFYEYGSEEDIVDASRVSVVRVASGIAQRILDQTAPTESLQ